jgi:hypothetical protein
MELDTAASRSPIPTPGPTAGPARLGTAVEQASIRPPAEYGCVDWYPYVTALEQPTEGSSALAAH